VQIPAAVRELALFPQRALPTAPGIEPVQIAGVRVAFTPYPNAQTVDPQDLTARAVPAAIEATRALARERGKSILAWMIAAEHESLVPALETEGLVNEDTPGLEAVENAMAIVEPPTGQAGTGVSVKEVETYGDFLASMNVLMDAFAIPRAMRDEAIPTFPDRWREFSGPASPSRGYLASLDGDVVGSAGAQFGSVGGYLFGGSVVEQARGRGVYRALTVARWEAAVARGTPALTILAGRMSLPVCERLGFQLVGRLRTYVDALDR
jgi:ribosomal protein S18 acetylase RimI-like enzyme